jgi:aspartate racemase
MNKRKTLGILGGLGPMSSVYFYEMLTAHTDASCDQEHLNILISSRADTPDRTDFITGRSKNNPLPIMREEVERLAAAGASIVAIPCNTAHYFYDGISESSPVPILNIIRETADFCAFLGLDRVGVLATEGTVRSGAYKKTLESLGIEYMTCSEGDQRVVSEIIYGSVKQGKEPDIDEFLRVADSLTSRGVPIVETTPIRATLPFGVSKYAGLAAWSKFSPAPAFIMPALSTCFFVAIRPPRSKSIE